MTVPLITITGTLLTHEGTPIVGQTIVAIPRRVARHILPDGG